MNDDSKINLSAQANAFFKKRLMLIESLKDTSPQEMDEADLVVLDDIPEHPPEPESSITTKTSAEKSLEALNILGNFPIDKSEYSPLRTHIGSYSFFRDGDDIDKLLNALLFSTKMAFFDTDSTTKKILSEVSTDSFGYMNILRKTQNEILIEQTKNIQTQREYFSSEEFSENIRDVKNLKEFHVDNSQRYLDFMINFYAKNVMSHNIDISKRKHMIITWLDKENLGE